MNRVLLLNRSEEIIDLISWQKAVVLFMQKKADCPYRDVESIDIRTVSGIFKLPTVLILTRYVHIPYKRVSITRENVLKRDKYLCQYCGRKLNYSNATVEHLVPTSRGGKTEWTNVVAACKSCNNKKDNLMPAEAEKRFGLKLKVKPFIPSRGLLLTQAKDLLTNQTWKRWLFVDDLSCG